MIRKTQQLETYIPYGQMNLIFSLRTLWLELATWTSSYLTSTASGLNNIEAVSERLYRIPLEIGNVLRLVFGAQSAEQFINLLSTHIITLENVITAQKNNESEAVTENVGRLYQNADEIATFLTQINPFWTQVQWRNLLYTYISLFFEVSNSLFTGEYERSVDAYDRLSYQTILIGDYMADGIIQYLAVRGPVQTPAPQ